jgi:hypothetical protein
MLKEAALQRYYLKESTKDSIVQCLLQLYSMLAMVCLTGFLILGLSPLHSTHSLLTGSSQYIDCQ